MNIKKYLRQLAENDEKNKLSEEDLQYCSQLAQSQQPCVAVKKHNYKLVALIATAAAIVLALAITLPLVLKKPVDDIFYREENIKSEACLLDDINSNYFQISAQSSEVNRIIVNYDSISNDRLYYTVNITKEIADLVLIIVTNENYNYDFQLSGTILTVELSQYSINYSKLFTNEMEVRYTGYITKDKETVYIEYTQLIDVGEQVFFDDIQSVLKVK